MQSVRDHRKNSQIVPELISTHEFKKAGEATTKLPAEAEIVQEGESPCLDSFRAKLNSKGKVDNFDMINKFGGRLAAQIHNQTTMDRLVENEKQIFKSLEPSFKKKLPFSQQKLESGTVEPNVILINLDANSNQLRSSELKSAQHFKPVTYKSPQIDINSRMYFKDNHSYYMGSGL